MAYTPFNELDLEFQGYVLEFNANWARCLRVREIPDHVQLFPWPSKQWTEGQRIEWIWVRRLILQGTVGTVEERILGLQKQKLPMANGMLTGEAMPSTNTFTIGDFELLFNPGPPAYGKD